MTKSNEWREFEKLVARIERAAAPKGALVTSPDKIRDRITGMMREVDASIQYQVGTTSILITIECRKRNRKDDVTWIEQLATKRDKIGASKTIAVSEAGFTASALQTAKHYNVEIRTLSEVTATDIEGWFLSGGAVHVFRVIEDIKCFIVLFEESCEPSQYGFYAPDVDDPVFYQKEIKSPFPISLYFSILERTDPERFASVPLDGEKVELEFPIEWEFGSLLLATTQGKRSVYLTKLTANVSYQSSVCDTESGTHHEYKSADGKTIQHTSFDTEMFDLPVRFEHQSGESGKQVAYFKFSPKDERKD